MYSIRLNENYPAVTCVVLCLCFSGILGTGLDNYTLGDNVDQHLSEGYLQSKNYPGNIPDYEGNATFSHLPPVDQGYVITITILKLDISWSVGYVFVAVDDDECGCDWTAGRKKCNCHITTDTTITGPSCHLACNVASGDCLSQLNITGPVRIRVGLNINHVNDQHIGDGVRLHFIVTNVSNGGEESSPIGLTSTDVTSETSWFTLENPSYGTNHDDTTLTQTNSPDGARSSHKRSIVIILSYLLGSASVLVLVIGGVVYWKKKQNPKAPISTYDLEEVEENSQTALSLHL